MNNKNRLRKSPIINPTHHLPLLTIKKFRKKNATKKNAPIKPNPKHPGLKIKIPTSRNFNMSPIQDLKKKNFFYQETKSLKKKYDKLHNKFIRITNILKSFVYFKFLIKNINNEKKLEQKLPEVERLRAEKQMINNIREMNFESKEKLKKNLFDIMVKNNLTLNFNYNDLPDGRYQQGRAMLFNNNAEALRPIIDAEHQQIIELNELKKLIYKNMIKNEIYQMMNHPDWDKDWLNKLMFYLEKWNFIIPVDAYEVVDIMKNKSKWVLEDVIKYNFLPERADEKPEDVISMLNKGMENKWIEEITKINNPMGDRKVHDPFELGDKYTTTKDLLTGKPLQYGKMTIPALKPLELDKEADEKWTDQLFPSSGDSKKGFFGGKRKKKTRRKKRRGGKKTRRKSRKKRKRRTRRRRRR